MPSEMELMDLEGFTFVSCFNQGNYTHTAVTNYVQKMTKNLAFICDHKCFTKNPAFICDNK